VPEWKEEIRERLADLKLAPPRETEIVEELAQHLEDRYEELLTDGATEEEAARAVLAELTRSILVRELRRVERTVPDEPVVWGARRRNVIADVWQDLRYSLRGLRKSPGLTAVAVLSLAVGIGANTAIFSVIDALMFRTLPVPKPEQLVQLTLTWDGPQCVVPPCTDAYIYPQFEMLRGRTDVFSAISAITILDRSNVTSGGPGDDLDPSPVRVELVSGSYFLTMGVQAVRGRTLTADDDRVPDAHPVVVISYAYWKRRFGLAPDVLGRTLELNGTTYTILGVTSPDFSGAWVGRPTDLWIPMMMQSQVMPERPGMLTNSKKWFDLLVVARLKPGVTVQQARAAAELPFLQDLRERAGTNSTAQETQRLARYHLRLDPFAWGYSPQREGFAQPLTILMAMVGLVLLIVCANVANLLLARSIVRRREIALRLALGASRLRIARQLLTESVVLALMGGVCGLFFAVLTTNALSPTVSSGPAKMISGMGRPQDLGVSLDLHLDSRVLAFTSAACLLTGILFGLVPAFRGSRVSLAPSLSEHGPNTHGAGGRFGLSKSLVTAQVALSLPLLIGAGLFFRTLHNLKSEDLGIDRQHLLLVWTAPEQTGRVGQALVPFYRTVQERLAALPGVRSVAVINGGFLQGVGSEGGATERVLKVEGESPKAGLSLNIEVLGPKHFETIGQPLLLGREFTDRDDATAPKVAVINFTLARFLFGTQNPIGRRLVSLLERDSGAAWEIVGVVKDANHSALRGQKIGKLYYAYPQYTSLLRQMELAVLTTGSPTSEAPRVRQELRDIDPRLPVIKIDSVDEQLDDVLARERFMSGLAAVFGGLAVLLVCVGLYGVISYIVARRTNEIGIRLALGATPAKVLRMVLMESLQLVFAGIAIGVPTTLALTRLISSRLFGVTATDLLTIVSAALLMIAVGALAAFLPAQRAARVDPLVALRFE